MPALADPTTWRKHPYHSRPKLFILTPAVVFKARVNQTVFTYPLSGVQYDTVTVGAYTDILPGMTVLFGSSEGEDDLGRQRIRALPDGAQLFIGWSSRGTLDGEVFLADNAYITVLNDYRAWSKIPRFLKDGTDRKDFNILPGTFPQEQPPIANAGPGMAGEVDATIGNKLRVTLPPTGIAAGTAVALGATITAYLWNIADGTLFSGTLTSSQITVDFPPGFRYVSVTVTDSNGKTHVNRVPIFAEGSGFPALTKFDYTRRLTIRGAELTLTLHETLAEATYPDGTLVMLWADEFYENTKGSLAGPAGRQHMKFVGWHVGEQTSLEGTSLGVRKGMQFTCVDIAGRLNMLPGFPQTIRRHSAAAKWRQMKNADMSRYLHYLLYWHSTALEIAPFTLPTLGSTYPFSALESDGAVLYEQVNGRAQAFNHVFTCNSKGQLAVKVDPLLQNAANRTTTIIVDLNDSDIASIAPARRRYPRVHWLDGAAIKTGTANAAKAAILPVFSLSPGKAPGQGADESNRNYQLVVDQAELNDRTGHLYARMNAPYEMIQLALVHNGDAGIEPADMEWIRVSQTDPTKSFRGIKFVNQRMLPVEVTETHVNASGQNRVEITCEVETEGLPAITQAPPDSGLPKTKPTGYDIFPTIDWGIDEGSEYADAGEDLGLSGAQMNIGLAWSNPIGYSSNFLSDYVNWENALGAMTGTVADAAAKWTGSVLQAFVVTYSGTTIKVYRNLDVVADPDNWTQDDTFTATGTGFTDKIRIRVSQTADLILVAWKARDGVRYRRRWNNVWGATTVVGSSAFSDTVNDAEDLGIAVRGAKQVVCGMTANQTYKLHYADSDGSFAEVASHPYTFTTPITTVQFQTDDSVFLSGKATLNEPNVFLPPAVVDLTGTNSNFTWAFTDSANWEDDLTRSAGNGSLAAAQFTPATGNRTVTLDWQMVTPKLADALQVNLIDTILGWTTSGHGARSFPVTITVEDDNGNTEVFNDTIDLPAQVGFGDQNGSIVDTFYTFATAGKPVTRVTILVDYGAVANEADFDDLAHTDFIGPLSSPTTANSDYLDGTSASRRLIYRVLDIDGTPGWSLVNTANYIAPTKHNGLAVDPITSAEVVIVGPDNDGNIKYIRSANSGVDWTTPLAVSYDWIRKAKDILVAGGGQVGLFDVSTDNFASKLERVGDWPEKIGVPGTYRGAVVLWGN